jgi:hypothetical protein
MTPALPARKKETMSLCMQSSIYNNQRGIRGRLRICA